MPVRHTRHNCFIKKIWEETKQNKSTPNSEVVNRPYVRRQEKYRNYDSSRFSIDIFCWVWVCVHALVLQNRLTWRWIIAFQSHVFTVNHRHNENPFDQWWKIVFLPERVSIKNNAYQTPRRFQIFINHNTNYYRIFGSATLTYNTWWLLPRHENLTHGINDSRKLRPLKVVHTNHHKHGNSSIRYSVFSIFSATKIFNANVMCI